MNTIVMFDQKLAFLIQQNLHTAFLDNLMIGLTTIANHGFIWLGIAGMMLIFPKTRQTGVATMVALLIATLTGEVALKHIVQRARPFVDFPSIQLLVARPASYSFPSGHTAASFAAATTLNRSHSRWVPIIWILASLIAFSRLYLFVHYPSDILAGIVLGVLSGWLALRMETLYSSRFNLKRGMS